MKIRILITALAILITTTAFAADRAKYNFNRGWLLKTGDIPGAEAPAFDDSAWQRVTLPRAFNEDEAFRVAIDQLTDTVMWYRKHFSVDGLGADKVFVEFEGVRQAGDFYLNGHHLGLHENGVMAVGFDLTPYMVPGDNVLAVRVDNDWQYRERHTGSTYQWNNKNFNANYGGIPKNVWLHLSGDTYQTLPLYSNLGTTGVYIYAKDFDIPGRKATVHAESQVRNDGTSPRRLGYRVTVKDKDGNVVKRFNGAKRTVQPGETAVLSAEARIGNLNFWSWGYGYLYDIDTELIEDGAPIDKVTTRTGFRKTQFGDGKFLLNDRVLMVHGYAQRTSNEWPALGTDIPAWLSDLSNAYMVESNGNLVRWMHVTPWKQDVESCDRVGLIQAMPAGDAEKDAEGRHWEQRTALMRDAIIYNRNNPSIIFYESGNESISRDHMLEMIAIRDEFDPHGGRAIGSREMLDIDEAEYGGEMLYINKSKKHPMWAMEYCRDESQRLHWDALSYPWHAEGAGPLYRRKPALEYNHNGDEFAIELIRRWYDYWRERPGTGTRVSSGGVKIVFSDTNTHFRCSENYRTSGVTDAMRIPKDAFFVHQAMWDGWVEPEAHHVYIIGHWNYDPGTVKPVYVVSNCDSVRLELNGEELPRTDRQYNFLHVFGNVAYQPGAIKATAYDAGGAAVSEYTVETSGAPAALRLTGIENPAGFRADGSDVAIIEFEVVDSEGRRCILDNRDVTFTLTGEGEWRGGIAHGYGNHILDTRLPVECGVNRAIVRSTETPGTITVKAEAPGLSAAEITFTTIAVPEKNGLCAYIPGNELSCRLDRGPTPLTPSYAEHRRGVEIVNAIAGANNDNVRASFDDNELSEWANDGKLGTAWITYRLAEPAAVEDVSIKLTGWRNRSYPLQVLAGDKVVWEGETPKSLGYVHLEIAEPVTADTYTIRLMGAGSNNADNASAGNFTELAGGRANELDQASQTPGTLRIIETEFLIPLP